jgi:hypothetical protein
VDVYSSFVADEQAAQAGAVLGLMAGDHRFDAARAELGAVAFGSRCR